MPTDSDILNRILGHFIRTAEYDQFNGLLASSLADVETESVALRSELIDLAKSGKINCVFSKYALNMYIKRFPDMAVEEQLKYLAVESLDSFCVYPEESVVRAHYDVSKWDDRPFSKELLLVRPQLGTRSFDMAVLERYTGDPRYQVHFDDYMGRMSIGDEAFLQMGFADRDKVSLQSFGLGIGEDGLPYLVVFLRYLASLSPEHQQYWNSFLGGPGVLMTRQYYQTSIASEVWKNRSVRYAIMQEIQLINRMTAAAFGRQIFRDIDGKDVPIGLASFLRPTLANFGALVMALDKLLSESLDSKFFERRVEVEEEVDSGHGRFERRRKGSLRLLEEWLINEFELADVEEFRKIVVRPLKEVRRLRQKPAHDFNSDKYSTEYHQERRRLLGGVLNSLQNLRSLLSTHPDAMGITVQDWLDQDSLDNF